jgi:phage terminase large subunit
MHQKDRTLYIDELLYKQGLTNQDISNHFLQLGLRKHSDIIYCDSAEPKSIEELYRLGWNVKPSLKGPDSVLKGIDTLKSYQLVVSPRSLNLIKELRNYQWQKDKDGKLVNKPIGLDHAIDCCRYGAITHFRVEKRSASFTMI